MRYNIIFLVILLIFTACEDKQTNKKVKNNNNVDFMVKKVKDINDTNKSMSQSLEEEGLLIDGARDKRLLDAFGMAVAKVIMEDGVYVPTCATISATGLLTNEECEEITKKYFSYYELYGEDGKKKITNVSTGAFESGIAGDEVSISEDIIDYESEFSTSNDGINAFIDESEDINALKKLSSKLGSGNEQEKEKIKDKIKYLKDKEVVKNDTNKDNTNSSNNNNESDEITAEQKKRCDEAKRLYSSSSSSLSYLKVSHENTKNKLDRYPDDERLINKFNQEENNIATYEANIQNARSELENCK